MERFEGQDEGFAAIFKRIEKGQGWEFFWCIGLVWIWWVFACFTILYNKYCVIIYDIYIDIRETNLTWLKFSPNKYLSKSACVSKFIFVSYLSSKNSNNSEIKLKTLKCIPS
jgi:hypothetical protein